MTTIQNILVPVDLGARSDSALAYARAIARAFRARLHVLHVTENCFLKPMASDPQTIVERKAGQLRGLLTREDRERHHAVTVLDTSDAPAEAIVSYADRASIDLIVMATHGHQSLGWLIGGSVTERVVRTAPCPVLTVRQQAQERGSATPEMAGEANRACLAA
jgi:nucleotide-binding universal stress UspA family protein